MCMYVFDLLVFSFYFFFFKQKTAYEMRISDWSSDVCSSDLKIAGDSECSFYSFGNAHFLRWRRKFNVAANRKATGHHSPWAGYIRFLPVLEVCAMQGVGRSVRGADKRDHRGEKFDVLACHFQFWDKAKCFTERSDEHTSELQSLMRISYAVL